MKQEFFNLRINTNGQKLYDFTDYTIEWIKKNRFKDGMLNLSIQHTSASLIVQENADPDVQTDLLKYFDNLAPMDEKLYIHRVFPRAIQYQHHDQLDQEAAEQLLMLRP